MARVRNTKAIKRKLNKLAKEFKNNNTELKRIAKRTETDLRASLRKGVKPNGELLQTISEAWSDRRDELADYNKTSKFFESNNLNSNATFTGELVKKIKTVVKGNKIIIFGKGNHKKYRGVNGKPIGKKVASIADIIQSFRDRGDELLGITDKTKNRVRKQFIRFLRRKR